MKEKIKARLKAKYSGVNLSTKRINAIVDKIEKKVADDAEDEAIDVALDTMNEYYAFADLAKEDDRVRTLEAKQKPEPPKEEPKPTDPPAEQKTEMQQLMEMVNSLTQTVSGLQKEKSTQTIKEKLKANPKIKDIPESVYSKWALPENDEAIETFADEVAAYATEHGIGTRASIDMPPPPNGNGKGDKAAPQKEIESITDSLMNITSKN